MTHELYKKYRPKVVTDIAGNTSLKKVLSKYEKNPNTIPHAILLRGISGGGKTTIARILTRILKPRKTGIKELNCADFKGIDTVREIRNTLQYRNPLLNGPMVWIIDECHQMTTAAQDAILKTLEDTPEYAYFFLATTNPGKLLPTIRTRCTELSVAKVTTKECIDYLQQVCKKEKIKTDDIVLNAICEKADGSMRKAMVLLDQIKDMDEEEQLETIHKHKDESSVIEICRLLLSKNRTWKEVTKLLQAGVMEDPEACRRVMLGYMTAVAVKNPSLASKAMSICEAFRDNYYENGQSGFVMSLWEAVNIK